MPRFNPAENGPYWKCNDYAKSISLACEDLRADYPFCAVFVWYTKPGEGDKELKVIASAPPERHSAVVRGHFEIHSYAAFYSTYGYEYLVMAEGIVDYTGSVDPTYMNCSPSSAKEKLQPSGTRYIFKRQTGTSLVKQVADVDPTNWMGMLANRDTTRLSAITLPGTHDSAALRGKTQPPLYALFTRTWGECQDLDIVGQLHAGIRSLDLRVGRNRKLRHGRMDLDAGYLDDALGAVNAFLDAHTSETVLVAVKWDSEDFFSGTADARPTDWVADIERKFCAYAHAKLLNGSKAPLLRDVAGKMLLKRLEGSSIGLDTPGAATSGSPPAPFVLPPPPALVMPPLFGVDEMQIVQLMAQYAKLEALHHKWVDVYGRLERIVWRRGHQQPGSGDDGWDGVGLNDYRLSTEDLFGGTIVTPGEFAAHLNTQLSAWLDRYVFFSQPVVLGVVEMDFAANTPGLVKKLILTNFK